MAIDVKAVPDGVQAIIPMLICADGGAMIEFCKTAFRATENVRRTGEDGIALHGNVSINGAMLIVQAPFPALASRPPQQDGSSPVVIFVYVPDVDQAVERAVTCGAMILLPVQDQFWGDRTARILDPFGHVWTVASRIEETTAHERDDRWSELKKNH